MRLLPKFYVPALAVFGSFVTSGHAEDQCRCVLFVTNPTLATTPPPVTRSLNNGLSQSSTPATLPVYTPNGPTLAALQSMRTEPASTAMSKLGSEGVQMERFPPMLSTLLR
ncbi:hypothetical protein LB505_013751 [Fusarium chuoi]|nr:hypothetical protein LB505_013751 [Fusarium chuoi]